MLSHRASAIPVVLVFALVSARRAPSQAAESPELEVNIGHRSTVWSVAWSPDGKTIASGGMDHRVLFWDAETGELKRTVIGHAGAVREVRFAPDGKTLASASADKTIVLWETSSGVAQRTLKGHVKSVTALAWSSDGRLLASASGVGGDAGEACIWDASIGEVEQALTGFSDAVTSVAFTPDGKTLMISSVARKENRMQGEVKFFDAQTGELKQTIAEPAWERVTAALSPDGKTLAIAGDLLRLYEVATSATSVTLQPTRALTKDPFDELVGSLAFAPDGNSLAAVVMRSTRRASGSALVWDVATGEWKGATGLLDDAIPSVAWSPDGERLVMANDRVALVYEAPTREPIEALTREPIRMLTRHMSDVLSVAWSADGKWIASLHGDGTVRWWDAHTGALTRTTMLAAIERYAQVVAFSPDSKRLAMAGMGVTLCDAMTGDVKPLANDRWLGSAAAWSPDGKTLAVPRERFVELRDAQTGEEERAPLEHREFVNCLAFAPHGNTLASGSSDKTVRLWDAASGELKRTLAGHEGWVSALAWSPDGSTLASGSREFGEAKENVKLWDVSTGEMTRTLTDRYVEVRSLAFTPDGEELVSLSASGRRHYALMSWNAKTGEGRVLAEGEGNASSFALSPDGATIVSGDDKTLRLHDLAPASLRASFLVLPTTTYAPSLDWIAFTPDGYFTGSPGATPFLSWRVGTRILPPEAYATERRQPEVVGKAFTGER